MSTAIHTRYLMPGNVRGARIKAFCKDGKQGLSAVISYPHELAHDRRHASAAKELAERLGWSGVWIVGQNADGSVSCVNAGRSDPLLIDPLRRRGLEGADWFIVAPQEHH